jgi:hypothetical protein
MEEVGKVLRERCDIGVSRGDGLVDRIPAWHNGREWKTALDFEHGWYQYLFGEFIVDVRCSKAVSSGSCTKQKMVGLAWSLKRGADGEPFWASYISLA